MTNVLAINGSYREHGFSDQVLNVMARTYQNRDINFEIVNLRDTPIEFCLNCRECTQSPGEKPGKCVLDDKMAGLVRKIEDCDALILASPTNFGSVTALFKRFMERLTVYAYWPWGQGAPVFRKADVKDKKKALIISSSAAPGFLGRYAFGSLRQLRYAANIVGAEPIDTVFTGFRSKEPDMVLPKRVQKQITEAANKLVEDK